MRISAHYILLSPRQVLKLHYIELDESNNIVKVAPLTEEIAGTAFYDGILFPSNEEIDTETLHKILKQKNEMPVTEALFQSDLIASDNRQAVFIYQLTGVNLSAAKFGTSDCGSHCHIQRL